MLIIGCYILSVVLGYFLFRTLYLIQGEEAQYNPHEMTFIIILFPILNVIFPAFMIIEELVKKLFSCLKIDYKKFFRLK